MHGPAQHCDKYAGTELSGTLLLALPIYITCIIIPYAYEVCIILKAGGAEMVTHRLIYTLVK